ncbi:hypothetical protein K438DRAFT_1972686 [Mycena galopus ATCC 62051]|nr:hypothetical protein K438DRAFT_1972686 [Mycena galopus ATCC 62051]
MEPAVDTFNQAVNQAVLVRFADGARVMAVSMYDIGPEVMADSLHPNDAGHALMASRWFGGLWQAAQWGWIDPATGDLGGTGPEPNFCPTNPIWYPQGEIVNGAGLGPNGGTYNCVLVYVFLASLAHRRARVPSQPNVQIQQFPAPASGQCSDLNDNSTAVRFADLNGDGQVEYLWLDDDGVATAFLNLGSTARSIEAGRYRHWSRSPSKPGSIRRMAAEYLFLHYDGSVDAWLNSGGPDDGPDAAKVAWFPAGTRATEIGQDGAAYLNPGAPSGGTGAANVEWLPQGVVPTGPANGATRDNVILADLNGIGRADYLTVTHDGGIVSLFINGGAPNDGPNAAQVVWYSQGVVATEIGTSGVGV